MTIPEIMDKENKKYNSFAPFSKGGMGQIYKGKCASTNEDVVLKLVEKMPGEDSEKQMREIDISKKLHHKNVVETIDAGVITLERIEYFYILMKYYSNGSMNVKITSKMPLDECFKWMMDILDGVEEIHKVAVHRDLKPENILIDDENHLRISDFGIAKYVKDRTKTHTFKGSGTLPYMAPECWKDESNTPKMDIYALGIIFYQMLTAKLPYREKDNMTETDWRNASLFEPVSSILKSRKDVPVQFEQMIQKMTSKRATERYNNIAEIKAVLQKITNSSEKNTPEYVDTIVSIANESIRNRAAADLKKEKEITQEKEYIALLRYHIFEITNKIKDAVELANSKLEVNKILLSEKDDNISTNYSLRISFMNKSLDIEFWDYKLINKYENERKEINKRNQMNIYGVPLSIFPYKPSFLVTNNISLIGFVKTNFGDGQLKESFNLLLEKPKNIDYGTWNTFQISKNITPPEPKFGLEKRDFLRMYEQYQSSPLHTCKNEKYDIQKIMTLITFMIQFN